MKKLIVISFIVLFVIGFSYYSQHDYYTPKIILQSQTMPGKLSASHAMLSTNCSSCHTLGKAIDEAKCISCHGDNKMLLERQPTAFHGVIANCSSCHKEHQGADANMRIMDHNELATLGEKIIGDGKKFINLNNSTLPYHPRVSDNVAKLNCASCHATKDKHFGFFGTNCASCHSDKQWTIKEFQHPSVQSVNCSQCHQAPPSHYMMHFEMVSKNVAGKSKEEGNDVVVSQCYACHRTTSWNDIQGVGFYKHH
ncbi:hypothetical protein EG349_13090 [Chryseobacterium shandongense]|jgi:hypothetical protein|uniref:Outer membrane cytochrome MtrC/MtrF-like domain-containing protein n=1 Tax=Chryseobacterium shandongense TaxID=1493872 RepID=A0AAD0YE03_9FLAO|nr:cytochrome c3 family protein [Chryseobacterium shandongense]AZA87660.1 hypothetical protein EG349_13090 [Chryseobacterium shandongense]AZA96159.1 hypothetical protein EG353_11550 [Chryseobacterium shandongense]